MSSITINTQHYKDITINDQHYKVLGSNLYQNTDTQEIVKGEQISEGFHLRSGKHLEGACIGNVSRIFTLLSPKMSFRGWENISKIDLLFGTWLVTLGILGITFGSLLSISALSVLTGILTGAGLVKTVSALFKMKSESVT